MSTTTGTTTCGSAKDERINKETELDLISDPERLLRIGVCKVPLPSGGNKNRDNWLNQEEWQRWASELSQVTPEILAGQGDGEYAFYRNILEQDDFPFELILNDNSEIGKAMLLHFGLQTLDEIELNDAFCIQYNTEQGDTAGARHVDPSDITVNLCLEKTPGTMGSHVLFFGTQPLENVQDDEAVVIPVDSCFLVQQEAGYATIHWGHHPHQTTALERGKRTNIVLCYWYKDQTKSNVATRSCYSKS